MKLVISLSSMDASQFTECMIGMGFKQTSKRDNDGDTVQSFSRPKGSEVFIVHNLDNDFLRVSYTSGREDPKVVQGTPADFATFFSEVTTAMAPSEN